MRADDGEDIAPVLEKVGQWSIYRRHRKGRAPSIRFSVSDEKFLSFLRDEGYLENPKRVLTMIPEELKYLWFRGLVDGDGCFYIHASNHPCYLNISSKIDEDWSYLTDQLSSLKIPFVEKAITRKNGKGNYSFVQIQRKLAIVAFGNWLYQANRDIGLRRKSLKFFKIRELLSYPA